VGREVHYCVYALECCSQPSLVGDIAFDEFEAFGELRESSGEIVVEQNLIAGAAQRARRVTADVACPQLPGSPWRILNALGLHERKANKVVDCGRGDKQTMR
jgi:hypothetical protein